MQTPFALPAQTSFESERSQHHFQSASAQEGLDSEFSEEDLSDPERAVTPRRSSRKRNVTQASKDGDDQVMLLVVASWVLSVGLVFRTRQKLALVQIAL